MPGPLLLTLAIIGGIVLLLVFIFTACYKKCPPNKAMVVTGPLGASTVIGKARIVIPIIQRVDYMSLENVQIDFTSRSEIPTKDAINILVDAVANMAIGQSPELLKIAASKFLGYTISDIQNVVTPILEGNIREIISQTELKELIQGDKKVFAERVVDNVTPNLADLGLTLTTFNIQNFKDSNGVIANLGIENTEAIRKDAAIAAAKAKADVEVAQAAADKAANDARVAAETEIAMKQNELAIRKAELKREADVKIAEANAAMQIEDENQRRTHEIAIAEANLAKQEKEIELKEREVQITEKRLEAEIKKKAEAEKYAAQQKADAELYETQKASEAELFERMKRAEAEAFEAVKKAEAQKELALAIKAEGEARAAATLAEGKAEAEATQAKLIAEAEGLRQKAEAMKLYGDAARQQMELDTLKAFFEQLPAIAEAVGKGYQNVDSIYMYGGDTSKLAGDIMTNVSQVSEGLSKSLGLDLKSLLSGMLGGKLASNAPVVVQTANGEVTCEKADKEVDKKVTLDHTSDVL